MSCPATGTATPRLSARCGSIPGTISVPVPTTKLPKASAARLRFIVTVLLESQVGARPGGERRRSRSGDLARTRDAMRPVRAEIRVGLEPCERLGDLRGAREERGEGHTPHLPYQERPPCPLYRYRKNSER